MYFFSENPFPTSDEALYTEREKKIHSAKADKWLGLKIPEVEEELTSVPTEFLNKEGIQQKTWTDIPYHNFLTPYIEIRDILEKLSLEDGDTIVDLGAGYGRLAHVIEFFYDTIHFIGYEFIKKRVEEAKRVFKQRDYQKSRMIEMDLTSPDFQLPKAKVYFIYDFGSFPAIKKTLQDLQTMAKNGPITVVGKGKGIRNVIERENPWLSQVNKPDHFKNYSIYYS